MRSNIDLTLNTHTFNGVAPVVFAGKAWYNYGDVLESVGLNRRGSSTRRKRAFPMHFKKIFGRNFISLEYFRTLLTYYEWRNRHCQLLLNFNPSEEL